jgi:hypothetical protein
MQSRPVTQIALKVNGSERTVEVDPNTPLLFVLNDSLVCADHGLVVAWRSAEPAHPLQGPVTLHWRS